MMSDCSYGPVSICSGVTESRDVDWHVSGTPLPTNQRPFNYKPLIILLYIDNKEPKFRLVTNGDVMTH